MTSLALPPTPFYTDLHTQYIQELGEKTDSYEYQVTEHLRMSGIYWGFTAMSLLKSQDAMNPLAIVEWVMQGYQYNATTHTGGWGGNTGHDVHLLYTTSAVQILAIAGQLQVLEDNDNAHKNAIVKYIQSLQQTDGSFAGDQWLEIDTRFSYCAMLTLSILNRLDAVDVPLSNRFIVSCQNFDGGYGCVPGAESHAGQIFCCVGALSVRSVHSCCVRAWWWWLGGWVHTDGVLFVVDLVFSFFLNSCPPACCWWCLMECVLFSFSLLSFCM